MPDQLYPSFVLSVCALVILCSILPVYRTWHELTVSLSTRVMYRIALGRLAPVSRPGLACRRWKSAPAPPAAAAASVAAEPFLTGTSSSYVEEMYGQWVRDPTSVHAVSTRRLR